MLLSGLDGVGVTHRSTVLYGSTGGVLVMLPKGQRYWLVKSAALLALWRRGFHCGFFCTL